MSANLALEQGFSKFPANFNKRPSRKCLLCGLWGLFAASSATAAPEPAQTRCSDGCGHILLRFCGQGWARIGCSLGTAP